MTMKTKLLALAIAAAGAAFASFKTENGRVSFSGAASPDEVAAARAELESKKVRADMASDISNFDALAGAPSLVTLDMRNVRGCSLEHLKGCPRLVNVILAKGAFPPEDVRSLEEALRANSGRAIVAERQYAPAAETTLKDT